MWFARGRFNVDDYTRMERQRCLINAVIKQANPTTVLSRYEAILKAGKGLILTDIPQEVLPMMVTLSLRVKDGSNLRSLVFEESKGFHSANPDFDAVRAQVKKAISEATTTKKPSGPSSGPTSGKPKPPKSSTTPGGGSSTETRQNLDDACTYQG